MHIKEGYERLKKQKTSESISNVKPANHLLIGSVHTSQINYNKNQVFFIDYKLKDSVKQAKQYIKDTIKDPDLFQIKKKKWNKSTITPKNANQCLDQSNQKSKLVKIRLGLIGFEDYSPIKKKFSKVYSGTQSRNDYSGWNISTSFDKKQKDIGQQTTNLMAIENTLKFNKQRLWNYKTLDERFGQSRQQQKAELKNNTQLLQNLKKSYVTYNPYASPQKIQANTRKMLYQSKRQKLKTSLIAEQEAQQLLQRSFKARISPGIKSNIKYVYFHTGNWEKCINLAKGNDSDRDFSDYHWSCCLSAEREGKGCSFRVEDNNRMNLAGFGNA